MSIEQVARACALVLKNDRESGTGYLVAPSVMVTCAHVVKTATPADLAIRFEAPDDELLRVAKVVTDPQHDVAVLHLEQEIQGRTPLGFSRTCPERTEWTTYGFPRAARWNGVPFSGVIDRLKGVKDRKPRVQLYSERVAAGMGTPLNGLSGSPVMVGTSVIGHVSEMMADEEGRPLFGLVYAIPAENVLALLEGAAAVSPQPQRPRSTEPSSHESNLRVHAAVAQLQNAGAEGASADPIRAAESLIAMGEPRAALRLLQHAPPSLRARQLEGLALAKSGQHQAATKLLEALLAEGHLDAETGSLLAGRYKEQGLAQGDRAKLRQAQQLYRATYERTGDAFPGINVAALALALDPDAGRIEAADLAQQLATSVESSMRDAPGDVDHWRVATLAEAQLLQGKVDEAKKTYLRAVELARGRPQDVAAMRRQARLDLRNLGKDASLLDDALPVPGIACFTGHLTDAAGRRPPRFPESKVSDVTTRVRALLTKHDVQYGVCSAARGGDLIFLGELLARGGSAKVILPFPLDSFKQTSVGRGWDAKFDELLDSPKVDLQVLSTKSPVESELSAAYAACNRALVEEALALSQRFDQAPRLIAVWNGSHASDGGTSDVVTSWRSVAGRELEVVAPFPV